MGTPINRPAKFDAASFILGGEIRNRTKTNKHINDTSTPCLSACVDNKCPDQYGKRPHCRLITTCGSECIRPPRVLGSHMCRQARHHGQANVPPGVPLRMGALQPPLIHFLGPTWVSPQRSFQSVQLFLHTSPHWCAKHTHRQITPRVTSVATDDVA